MERTSELRGDIDIRRVPALHLAFATRHPGASAAGSGIRLLGRRLLSGKDDAGSVRGGTLHELKAKEPKVGYLRVPSNSRPVLRFSLTVRRSPEFRRRRSPASDR